MKRYERLTAAVLLFSRLVGVLAACGAEPTASVDPPPAGEATQPPAQEAITLTWLQWWVNEWGPENHAALIKGFEDAHPGVTVKVVDVPWPDMAGKIQAAAAGGSEQYDIIGVENDWIASMVKQGYVENLDPLLAADATFADSLTSVTPMEYLGETKALCLYLIPYQFAYNVELFEQEGLEPPSDWDEFADLMAQLKDEAANKYGIVMSIQDASVIATRYFGFRLAQEGGQWLDGEGNPAFNSPEGVAALQWWIDFYNQGLMAPGSLGADQALTLELVASGQVPSIIDGPFVWTKAKQIDPDIKMAYAPPWKDKTGGYSWACSGVALGAKSQNKEMAWEFIEYLYSKDVALKMTETVNLPWATNDAMESLEGSDNPMLKYIPQFANQDAAHNVLYPVLPSQDKLLDAIKLAFQQALTGEKDAQTALDEAAAVWQAELDAARSQ